MKKENNVYAICTKSVGRKNEKKYKKCKEEVGKKLGNPVTIQQVQQVAIPGSEERTQKIKDIIGRPLFERIQNEYKSGKSIGEIWEDIEVEEAVKELPGKKIKFKDKSEDKIESITEVGKIRPKYRLYFPNHVFRELTKKELIDLWTTGETIEIKLIPEVTTKDKIKEGLGLNSLFIEVSDNEVSKIFKSINDEYRKYGMFKPYSDKTHYAITEKENNFIEKLVKLLNDKK